EPAEAARQGLPLALEDAEHVDAERLRHQDDGGEEDQDLRPTDERHGGCLLRTVPDGPARTPGTSPARTTAGHRFRNRGSWQLLGPRGGRTTSRRARPRRRTRR